jgi:hypothetical protein
VIKNEFLEVPKRNNRHSRLICQCQKHKQNVEIPQNTAMPKQGIEYSQPFTDNNGQSLYCQ